MDEDAERLMAEAAAMQFAGGWSLERVAREWERDVGWAEDAVRRALLATIPERVGGLRPSRAELAAERGETRRRLEELQGTLELNP